jgi:hypothetical protein
VENHQQQLAVVASLARQVHVRREQCAEQPHSRFGTAIVVAWLANRAPPSNTASAHAVSTIARRSRRPPRRGKGGVMETLPGRRIVPSPTRRRGRGADCDPLSEAAVPRLTLGFRPPPTPARRFLRRRAAAAASSSARIAAPHSEIRRYHGRHASTHDVDGRIPRRCGRGIVGRHVGGKLLPPASA